MEYELPTKYEQFLVDNRANVNKYLNIVLWFFVVTGPAIAAGVHAGVFKDIRYSTCVGISVVVVLLSGIHLLMLKTIPKSTWTCLFALTALDVLIVYMACSHVSIYLTWFLVPLLSILFCDRSIYFYAMILNYILMVSATWATSPYEAALQSEYDSSVAFFADRIGGFTIESLIMFASGYIIGKLTTRYFKKLFSQYQVISEQEKSVTEKMKLLDSMAEIYDNVNLIDFVNNTEMSLRDVEQKKHGIDMSAQTHTLMAQQISNQVMPDQVDVRDQQPGGEYHNRRNRDIQRILNHPHIINHGDVSADLHPMAVKVHGDGSAFPVDDGVKICPEIRIDFLSVMDRADGKDSCCRYQTLHLLFVQLQPVGLFL